MKVAYLCCQTAVSPHIRLFCRPAHIPDIPLTLCKSCCWCSVYNREIIEFIVLPISTFGQKYMDRVVYFCVLLVWAAYCDILGNGVLPILRKEFGVGPLLFQHDNTHMHKESKLYSRSTSQNRGHMKKNWEGERGARQCKALFVKSNIW